MAMTFAAIAAVVAANPGVAHATYFNEYATPTDRKPIATPCVSVYGGDGVACFGAYGDKFWIRDNEFDGLHVEMHGWVYDDHFVCWTTRGPNYAWQICEGFPTYIPENVTIRFQARLYNGGTFIARSANKYATT
ncbi:MAG: hypothetical protein ACRDT6_17845 [Micromonosporaceae bacterium]